MPCQPSSDPATTPTRADDKLEADIAAYQAAVDQNTIDRDAGRSPRYGNGAIHVLAKRVAAARAAVDELAQAEPA